MSAHSLEDVAWEPCLLEPTRDAALESYVRKKLGVPHPAIRYFVALPWLTHALVDLHPEYGLLMRLDLALGDLIQLVVSQENSCRYCYAAVRSMLRIQGMSEDRIRRVEGNLTRTDLPPREAAALTFARALSRSTPAAASVAKQALLDTGVDVSEMKEIAFVAASINFMNRASTAPAIPPYGVERLPSQFHVRLLRPLIARLLRRTRSQGQPTPLDSGLSYPYAGLVESFAGSPIAPALAKALAEMWASPVLTRRCKLLLFAVIARGLGCGACASEAARALLKDGFSEDALTKVLTHLDAPELDPIERLLVPFARETIWYEPAPLQRRARGVRDQLSPTQFLEAIGVLSLANGLCRLGAIVADHPLEAVHP
jgi:AhpD family alkylhydroperoxidase